MENLKIPTAADFAFRTKRYFMQDYFSELDADGNLVLDRTDVSFTFYIFFFGKKSSPNNFSGKKIFKKFLGQKRLETNALTQF